MNAFELDEEFQKFKDSGQLYKQIFDCSVLPIIIHDMFLNIIDVNDKAIEEFGYSKDELLELRVLDLHADTEMEHSLEVLEKMKEMDSLSVRTSFKKKDGSIFTAEAIPCKLEFKRSHFIHVHLKDIQYQD